MAQDRFDFATVEQFPEVVTLKAALMTRRLNGVHLHHSFMPDQALYRDLAGPQDRNGEAAGAEICRRIWSQQTERQGWVDIAQHVTIDPAGRIWIGRDWNLPPASAAGHNGNATLGPFMLVLVGNFEPGADRPGEAQLEAAAVVIAAVQAAFDLAPETLATHVQLDGHRSCPGQIDLAALTRRVAALRKAQPAAAGRGPLGDTQREAYRLLNARRGEAQASRPARALGDEAATCRPWEPPSPVLASARGAAARGGDGALTPEMFRLLRPHVVHLENGRFVDSGSHATTRSDVQQLVAAIGRWAAGRDRPRVLIWAHGGLVDEERALAYAWHSHRWWLDSGIYPVFFIWETGALETALQIVESQLGARARDRGIGDWVVESLVHAVGRPFWRQMKGAAANAAMALPDRGAFVLAELLAGLAAKKGPRPELHAVGHSAGAFFQGDFLTAATGAPGLAFDSLTFLAPACTVRFFDASVVPLLDAGKVGRFRMFTLDRSHELADPTVPFYDKSLLYLISRGFEDRRGEPILGLEECIRQDDGLIARFGLDGGTPASTLVLCPTPAGAPAALASGAKVHGGFAQDPQTLEAIRADILGAALALDAPPAPVPMQAQGRGDGAMFRSFREAHPLVFDALPVAAHMPASMPAAPPAPPAPAILPSRGMRRALSIGIDAYEGGNALAGCVADSQLWAGVFAGLGFEVATLHDGQATRAGIMAALEAMILAARPGDVLALHYSGHGTQFPDLDGDEVGDDQDEAFVPIDGLSHGEYLIDDDVRMLFGQLDPQVDFTFLADCCHSGTISRLSIGSGAAPRYRERYIRATPEMVAAHRQMRQGLGRTRALPQGGEERMTHLLFSACKASQTAKESDGNGWFSRAATEVLRAAREPLSNRELLRRIQARFAELGYADREQDPQIEGRDEAKDRPVLGGLLQARR
ncbi:caspase family protein [Paracoccus sp. (in: a-proteobacteria)]|uniref:caspase family protein n=1 Tax=Paracoccus sp. TaxID=267 RepID=UPI00321FC39B